MLHIIYWREELHHDRTQSSSPFYESCVVVDLSIVQDDACPVVYLHRSGVTSTF